MKVRTHHLTTRFHQPIVRVSSLGNKTIRYKGKIYNVSKHDYVQVEKKYYPSYPEGQGVGRAPYALYGKDCGLPKWKEFVFDIDNERDAIAIEECDSFETWRFINRPLE